MHPLHDAPEDEGHVEHVALPVISLYFPAIHAVQLLLDAVKPTLHVQLPRVEYPVKVELEFAGQLTHAVAPRPGE